MKHLKRFLAGAAVVVAPIAAVVWKDPSLQHYIAVHPALAVYVPVAVGLIRAAYKAFGEHAAAG
jgi:hypothetical protein